MMWLALAGLTILVLMLMIRCMLLYNAIMRIESILRRLDVGVRDGS